MFLYCICVQFSLLLNIVCVLYFSFVLIALSSPENSQQKFANSIDYFPYYYVN